MVVRLLRRGSRPLRGGWRWLLRLSGGCCENCDEERYDGDMRPKPDDTVPFSGFPPLMRGLDMVRALSVVPSPRIHDR